MRRRFFNNNIEYFDINDYLTIEALEDNLQIYFPNEDLMYGIDGLGWQKLVAGAYSPAISKGQTISFRGNLTPNSSNGIGTFTISKKCNLKGNCMSMLFGDNAADNFSLSGKAYAFVKLFYGCTNIVNVSSNFLPATTLASDCYSNMFNGCTNLTTAPELPATTLADYCYNSMFYNCTSLTTAPELPATTLADSCYSNMFYDCTNLTTAPELPATTLADYCYNSMFNRCTALTTAPVLPATTLADYCYNSMFYGCKSLTIAPVLPATTLAKWCYEWMFYGCKSLTIAPVLPATTLAKRCCQYMFYGCTGLTTAPELPATNLAESCYYEMFCGCTNLTTAPTILPATTLVDYCYHRMFYNCTNLVAAPELPATTLAYRCYREMFYNCNKLNYIKMLATDISASNCLLRWMWNVSSTGTFVKNPNMTTLPTGADGIPSGWTVVNDGEESGGNLNLVIDYDNLTQNDVDQIINYMMDNGWTTDNRIDVQVINSNITVLYQNTEYPITWIIRSTGENSESFWITLFTTDIIGNTPYFTISEEDLDIGFDD